MLDITLQAIWRRFSTARRTSSSTPETRVQERRSASSEERFRELIEEYRPDKFSAGMGGEAVLGDCSSRLTCTRSLLRTELRERHETEQSLEEAQAPSASKWSRPSARVGQPAGVDDARR
jgi:hypothetical protein